MLLVSVQTAHCKEFEPPSLTFHQQIQQRQGIERSPGSVKGPIIVTTGQFW
jgi:hypothetical protein